MDNCEKEAELMRYFEIEELEQRFELGWIKGGEVGAQVESGGDFKITSKVKF
ncbi:hypothetical protein [Aureicoccus marinus]|jgi:hypothetical protein|uniref:hypothetical protein n=1 Tax=Aureicoccus marinus TaxID=754435 RepID=UPI0015E44414|nr:hypothetical protein [Aureicoccus marinus]